MNQSISSIFTLVLLLQGLVYFWAWVEKRLKPVLTKFRLIEHDVLILHEIGMLGYCTGRVRGRLRGSVCENQCFLILIVPVPSGYGPLSSASLLLVVGRDVRQLGPSSRQQAARVVSARVARWPPKHRRRRWAMR